MEELARKDHMSVHGVNGEPEVVVVSMGVAYKLDEDVLYMVKIPVEGGEVRPDGAVMVDGEDFSDEFPEERVPREAVGDGVEWFEDISDEL